MTSKKSDLVRIGGKVDGDADAIDFLLKTIRDIHIHKTTVPEPLWWKS